MPVNFPFRLIINLNEREFTSPAELTKKLRGTEMTKLIRAIMFSCALTMLLAGTAWSQYGGTYRGGGGTTYRRPSSATSSLILRNSIRRAQIRKQKARAAKRRHARRSLRHAQR
jgi:hypothetical protein